MFKIKNFFVITVLFFGAVLLVGAGCSNSNSTNVANSANEPITLDNAVSTEECAELMAYGPKIDMRYNDLATAYPWTVKYYDRMAELEAKYSITQDELAAACKTKQNEPGFDDEVKKQEGKLQ